MVWSAHLGKEFTEHSFHTDFPWLLTEERKAHWIFCFQILYSSTKELMCHNKSEAPGQWRLCWGLIPGRLTAGWDATHFGVMTDSVFLLLLTLQVVFGCKMQCRMHFHTRVFRECEVSDFSILVWRWWHSVSLTWLLVGKRPSVSTYVLSTTDWLTHTFSLSLSGSPHIYLPVSHCSVYLSALCHAHRYNYISLLLFVSLCDPAICLSWSMQLSFSCHLSAIYVTCLKTCVFVTSYLLDATSVYLLA